MLPLFLAAFLVQDDLEIRARMTPESRVAERVRPAVVYIESLREIQVWSLPFGRPILKEETRSGSGVVVDERGYIITNLHLVGGGDDHQSITVQFDSTVDRDNSDSDHPRKWPAKLLSASADSDLALLKVDTDLPLTTIELGTSSDLMVGERVIAIGNPFGQRLTVSSGIISGLHRKLQVAAGSGAALVLDDLIQTDAAINHGNSGGPLLNILGKMIGITTLINEGAENMGFAIPVDHVEEVLRDQLLSSEASRAWYGFEVEDSPSMCINKVVPGSPAADAGVEVGYRLLAVDGTSIKTSDDFRLLRLSLVPNRPVRFRIGAAEGEREVELRGWNRVDGIIFDRLAMKIDRCAVGGSPSVCVQEVYREGPARELGLQAEDVIDSVRHAERGTIFKFESGHEFAAFVRDLPSGTKLDFDILRDENRDGRLRRSELYKGSLTVR